MSVRHLFVLNPKAGQRDSTPELTAQIKSVMAGRGQSWDIATTHYSGHAEKIASDACATGDDLRIYACGGDGTLHQVVAGALGYENCAVTQYPCGSGNDYLRMFGDGRQAFFDLNLLVDGVSSPVDVMGCNGRPVLNICAVGLDARVGNGMDKYRRLPLVGGALAYQLSLVEQVIAGIHRPYRVTVDGEVFDQDFTLLCTCNGRYYGGGFNPCPTASVEDGVLDFVLVKGLSRLQVASVVKTYKEGRASALPEHIILRSGKSMTIGCNQLTAANVDGEMVESAQFTIQMLEDKVGFIRPIGVEFAP